MRALVLLTLLALAACGADGAPEPQSEPRGAVSVFGTASIGIKGAL